jgi:hypothetical protein
LINRFFDFRNRAHAKNVANEVKSGNLCQMNDAGKLRNELLQVIKDATKGRLPNLQSNDILGRFRSPYDTLERQQALLTLWQDLFRTGYLAWGRDLNNPDPPFFHLTERGKKSLEHFSRDPVNPTGYLAYVAKEAKINSIAQSYLEEALKTFNNDCVKSSVVMTGAAAESLAFELRDVLILKMTNLKRNIPKDLPNSGIKKVLDGLEREISAQKNKMPVALRETFESQWSAFAHQIRLARNDAGHPKSIEPVTFDDAHAALLIFPKLAKLNADLTSWISTSYS